MQMFVYGHKLVANSVFSVFSASYCSSISLLFYLYMYLLSNYFLLVFSARQGVSFKLAHSGH